MYSVGIIYVYISSSVGTIVYYVFQYICIQTSAVAINAHDAR